MTAASTQFYGTGRRKTSTARVFLRPGNGAMEELARRGLHAPPARATVEAVLAHAWSGRRGTVLVDTWDLGRAVADAGDPAILAREWEAMNRAQSIRPPNRE